MLWRWAKRRHSNKSRKWIKNKYFISNSVRNWIFSTKNATLIRMIETPIRRHIKIRSDTNPYDIEQEVYFEEHWAQIHKKDAAIK